jgi:hypothetical protein
MFNLTIRRIAQAAWEATRSLKTSNVYLGDPIPPWAEANDFEKSIAEAQVKFYMQVCRTGGGVAPDIAHSHRMQYIVNLGFCYGTTPNYDNKLHPDCIAWEKLTEEQKLREWVFGGICSGAYYMAYSNKNAMKIIEEAPESVSYSQQAAEDAAASTTIPPLAPVGGMEDFPPGDPDRTVTPNPVHPNNDEGDGQVTQ